MSPLILVCIVVALVIIALVAFVAVTPLLRRKRPGPPNSATKTKCAGACAQAGCNARPAHLSP